MATPLAAVATDVAGNAASSPGILVSIDTTAPTVTFNQAAAART